MAIPFSRGSSRSRDWHLHWHCLSHEGNPVNSYAKSIYLLPWFSRKIISLGKYYGRKNPTTFGAGRLQWKSWWHSAAVWSQDLAIVQCGLRTVPLRCHWTGIVFLLAASFSFQDRNAQTRDWTHALGLKAWNPNHWTTRKLSLPNIFISKVKPIITMSIVVILRISIFIAVYT